MPRPGPYVTKAHLLKLRRIERAHPGFQFDRRVTDRLLDEIADNTRLPVEWAFTHQQHNAEFGKPQPFDEVMRLVLLFPPAEGGIVTVDMPKDMFGKLPSTTGIR